jgi:hypothetical protein
MLNETEVITNTDKPINLYELEGFKLFRFGICLIHKSTECFCVNARKNTDG